MAKDLRDLIEAAESALNTYRRPNISEAEERLRGVLQAAGMSIGTRDGIDSISEDDGVFHIRSVYSVRGCEGGDSFELPSFIVDADDPLAAARKWSLGRQISAAERRVENLRAGLQEEEAKLAKLRISSGVQADRTDHIRSVPGGAAFLRVATLDPKRHTTKCKHYDNNCGAVHPSNCPDCPFRTAGVALPVHPNLKGLAAALRSQRQVDEDGTEVGVSRQAADEAAAIIEALDRARGVPPCAEVIGYVHKDWEPKQGQGRIYGHCPGPDYKAVAFPDGVQAAQPAHSKSEYKRRVAQGDPNVAPPTGVSIPREGQPDHCQSCSISYGYHLASCVALTAGVAVVQPEQDTRKPWERTDWNCALARVDHEGLHCPDTGRCADCPNGVEGKANG